MGLFLVWLLSVTTPPLFAASVLHNRTLRWLGLGIMPAWVLLLLISPEVIRDLV